MIITGNTRAILIMEATTVAIMAAMAAIMVGIMEDIAGVTGIGITMIGMDGAESVEEGKAAGMDTVVAKKDIEGIGMDAEGRDAAESLLCLEEEDAVATGCGPAQERDVAVELSKVEDVVAGMRPRAETGIGEMVDVSVVGMECVEEKESAVEME
jgi:hypothetical protein